MNCATVFFLHQELVWVSVVTTAFIFILFCVGKPSFHPLIKWSTMHLLVLESLRYFLMLQLLQQGFRNILQITFATLLWEVVNYKIKKKLCWYLFLLLLFKNNFIFGCAGSLFLLRLFSCCAQAPHCGMVASAVATPRLLRAQVQ